MIHAAWISKVSETIWRWGSSFRVPVGFGGETLLSKLLLCLEYTATEKLVISRVQHILRLLVNDLSTVNGLDKLVALQHFAGLLSSWIHRTVTSKLGVAILLLRPQHRSSFHKLFSFCSILLGVECVSKSELTVDRVLGDQPFLHRQLQCQSKVRAMAWVFLCCHSVSLNGTCCSWLIPCS